MSASHEGMVVHSYLALILVNKFCESKTSPIAWSHITNHCKPNQVQIVFFIVIGAIISESIEDKHISLACCDC